MGCKQSQIRKDTGGVGADQPASAEPPSSTSTPIPAPGDPKLPLDLIHRIGEQLLADQKRQSLASLMRASKAIYESLSPILYACVTLCHHNVQLFSYGALCWYLDVAAQPLSEVNRSRAKTADNPALSARKMHLLSLVRMLRFHDMYDDDCAEQDEATKRDEAGRVMCIERLLDEKEDQEQMLLSCLSNETPLIGLRQFYYGDNLSLDFSSWATSSHNPRSIKVYLCNELEMHVARLEWLLGCLGFYGVRLEVIIKPHRGYQQATIIGNDWCGVDPVDYDITGTDANSDQWLKHLSSYDGLIAVHFYPLAMHSTFGDLTETVKWKQYVEWCCARLNGIRLGWSTVASTAAAPGARLSIAHRTVTVWPPNKKGVMPKDDHGPESHREVKECPDGQDREGEQRKPIIFYNTF